DAPELFEPRERDVSRVGGGDDTGLVLAEERSSLDGRLPARLAVLRIPDVVLDRVLRGVVALPEPVRPPEVRDPGFRRDAGAGERHAGPRPGGPLRDEIERVVHGRKAYRQEACARVHKPGPIKPT